MMDSQVEEIVEIRLEDLYKGLGHTYTLLYMLILTLNLQMARWNNYNNNNNIDVNTDTDKGRISLSATSNIKECWSVVRPIIGGENKIEASRKKKRVAGFIMERKGTHPGCYASVYTFTFLAVCGRVCACVCACVLIGEQRTNVGADVAGKEDSKIAMTGGFFSCRRNGIEKKKKGGSVTKGK